MSSSAQPSPVPDAGRPAFRSRAAWLTLLSVTVAGLAADLLSKWAAFRFIAPSPVQVRRADVLATDNLSRLIPAFEPITIIPNVLDLTLVLNRGAVFGIGAGRRWFFVLFTLAALVLACWMFAKWTRARDRAAHVALGLLISGGLGNLYDRIVFACVRDFIHPLPGVTLPFGWRLPNGEREIWPYVSNVADLWLLIGIGILMWHLWRQGSPTARPAEPNPKN